MGRAGPQLLHFGAKISRFLDQRPISLAHENIGKILTVIGRQFAPAAVRPRVRSDRPMRQPALTEDSPVPWESAPWRGGPRPDPQHVAAGFRPLPEHGSEDAEPSTGAQLVHGGGIARLAASDNVERVGGAAIGLVELRGLRVAERDPVADRPARRQRRPRHRLAPASGDQRAARTGDRGDRRRAGTGRATQQQRQQDRQAHRRHGQCGSHRHSPG